MGKLLELLIKNTNEKLFETRKSQSQLAKDMGINQSQLNRILTGKTEPGIETVSEIASALQCQPHELLMEYSQEVSRDSNQIDPIASDNKLDKVESIVKRNTESIGQILNILKSQYRSLSDPPTPREALLLTIDTLDDASIKELMKYYHAKIRKTNKSSV